MKTYETVNEGINGFERKQSSLYIYTAVGILSFDDADLQHKLDVR